MTVRRLKEHQINVRMSDAGKRILEDLQAHLGLSQGSIFEMLLREEARRIGLPIPGTGAYDRTVEERRQAQEKAEKLRDERRRRTRGDTLRR